MRRPVASRPLLKKTRLATHGFGTGCARATGRSLTFPGIGANVREIFTALLFAQQPDYFERIQELQQSTCGSDKVVPKS
jgi:hypothetical protein